MKTLFALVAACFLSTAPSAFAQFTSSPLESGLFEYSRTKLAGVALVDTRHISTDAVDIEWVSPEQITISATVTYFDSRQKAEMMVSDYNDGASVGTMKIVGRRIELVHHVNPKMVRQDAMIRLIARFSDELDTLKKESGESMAVK